MKTFMNLLILATVATFITSCDGNTEIIQTNLSNQIAGTYKGTLTSSVSKIENPATAEITPINDYTISVRCYGIDVDTTIVLELYPDGNMMRVCFNDDNFKNEYGHNMSTNHHMMGKNGSWTSWQQHMSNEHDTNDKHYGYFDMNATTFQYAFEGNSFGGDPQQFIGKK